MSKLLKRTGIVWSGRGRPDQRGPLTLEGQNIDKMYVLQMKEIENSYLYLFNLNDKVGKLEKENSEQELLNVNLAGRDVLVPI